MRICSERFYDTLIIGSGCAGYNAADWLYDLGRRDIAILTEGVEMGTSRNTGSDKQTYYKLSLTSEAPDSVRETAETLFAGGAMHGDTALIEAACGVKAFFKLVMLGVDFPVNRYGEYVGYKTDHDPRRRATSCGPLTSGLMTGALERSVGGKGIEVIDRTRAVRLLTGDGAVTGVLATDAVTGGYRVFACNNIILATGGPAGIYHDSVYPESQTGASGLAVNAGAEMVNLCEWQYGLASVKFRWNVSGTYQQALPKYVSVSPGGAEREILSPGLVFLKGYQWPFDVRKINGSSRADMLVCDETLRGNRVFMDYRVNPSGLGEGFEGLPEEAREYLINSGAAFGTPVQRLEKMNPKAVKLYKDNGIDLHTERLEVAVCAQHCNGGVAVDANWESTVSGLYAAGEAAGTHGVYRPGGSALNAGQVGSMRAAEHIARKKSAPAREVYAEVPDLSADTRDIEEMLDGFRRRMSRYAAHRRDTAEMKALLEEVAAARSRGGLPHKAFDTLTSQAAVLSAMIFAAQAYGSRGSCVVDGCAEASGTTAGTVVITKGFESREEKVRPMPEGGGWFETVWNDHENRGENDG